jgi:hypothetical protein
LLKADTVADKVAVNLAEDCQVNVDSDYALSQPDPNLNFLKFVRYTERCSRTASNLAACDSGQNKDFSVAAEKPKEDPDQETPNSRDKTSRRQ